ncbi:hypothetical protein KDA_58140 [Dictyobacter alpinus]|uniref:Uncharacterized protein n=1 Tax=Dictyobacter alpinus TaxID=2014873 RepID=A0A402BFX2_9CHLR|nr:hypothetical protein KDA_57820 [Dictyobacter alpinus]GCE30330.1 hypothetical protein KDA_58140 [Dictyobacter alpinus]
MRQSAGEPVFFDVRDSIFDRLHSHDVFSGHKKALGNADNSPQDLFTHEKMDKNKAVGENCFVSPTADWSDVLLVFMLSSCQRLPQKKA